MHTYEDELIIKEMNLPDNKTISREMDYYYRVTIPPSCCVKHLNINGIYTRKVERHFEGFSEYPQNLFFLLKEISISLEEKPYLYTIFKAGFKNYIAVKFMHI